jgi:tRNA(adenine34) deaminase
VGIEPGGNKSGSGEILTSSELDQEWMRLALSLAHRAEQEGEVPVGAVVVKDGELVGQGWNRNIGLNDASAHAEIMALRDAGRRLANHRLPDCVMYVTLEPCAMCVSAAIHSRLAGLIFGASDPKTGALGGAYCLTDIHRHNHELKFSGGLLAEEAATLLRRFFGMRRKQTGG